MSKTTSKRLYYLEKYIQNKWDIHYWNFLMKVENKIDWADTSTNPNITIEIIEKYPNVLWCWRGLSINPNITMEMIEKYSDKNWDWSGISNNPNITMEFIENRSDKPWDWEWISRNPNITMEMIENNLDKPWDWYWISKNPNLTMDFIERHPDKPWEWNYISENLFEKEKELFYQKYYRIYFATFRLQQYFNRMYDNPQYKFCRDRIEKLFSEQ